MGFTRSLFFQRGDIGKRAATLLLCFQVPNPDQLYKDQFSVAWRVVNFDGVSETEEFDATYESQLFFCNPQINGPDNIVKPSRSQSIDVTLFNSNPQLLFSTESQSPQPGQKTVLHENDNGEIVWSKPEKASGKLVHALNDTGSDQDIGIGFVDGASRRLPIIVFDRVVNGLGVAVEFKPLLQAYVVTGYKESGLLKGAIESFEPIWTQDLLPLNNQSNWVFYIDPETRSFTIKSAS